MPTRRSSWIALVALILLSFLTAACAAGSGRGSPETTADPPARGQTAPSTTIATTTTAPPPVVKVAAAGDIACVPGMAVTAVECQMEATAQLVETYAPAHVLALGDLQYEYGELDHFRASYDRSWGRFRSATRPVVGNHEYAGGRARGYYEYWGDAAAPPNGWYAFDLAEVGWRIVVVNSVCSVVGCSEGSAQLAWLREQLASSPACTVVAMHHPRHTSGLHGDDSSLDTVWRAIVDAGADVVLSGHDHHYERLVPEDGGPRQFIVGTGGRNLYPVILRRSGSEFVDATRFGILELELSEASYRWRFRAIGGAGVVDEGTSACR